ncbi:MAG TPA: GDSL-type esterase/lipase family protein [Ktedonobacterales bacterium]|nr:GDSL-type esterase/lipase family protein [Ktedonobacterales bacterium]
MRVIFFGDSLTKGVDGASYLRILVQRVAAEPRLHTDGLELVNAGVGGDTVVNLLARLHADVVARKPDAVVIFVGVNDCTTLLLRRSLPRPRSLLTMAYFWRRKGLRRPVTPERFERDLRTLVAELRRQTGAQVALCTPATMGESLSARSWRLLGRYADAARRVAADTGCELLDVHVAFRQAIAALPPAPPPRWSPAQALRVWRVRRAASDFEALAKARGLRLTYDGVHLTAAGAVLAADVIWPWLAALGERGGATSN